MTRDEMKQILARIDVLYPNWHPADLTLMIDVWMEELGALEYNDLLFAVKAYTRSDTSGFAPKIGNLLAIIENAKKELAGDNMGELEAWGLVSRALRNSTYHATEEFNKLPKTIQKAVGSSQVLSAWALSDNFNENVAQSNFLSAYRNVLEREKNIRALPVSMQNAIAANNNKMLEAKT